MATTWKHLVIVAVILLRLGEMVEGSRSGGSRLRREEWASGVGRIRSARHVVPPPTAPQPTPPPEFNPLMPTNVTVAISSTALLPCIVHNLGNNSVSWIRHRDLRILTVGAYTYTSDERFSVVPQNGSEEWVLKLRYAAPRDTGRYDCQVSSTPPITRTVHLTVFDPRAKILGAPEVYVEHWSNINLTCVVYYSPQPPGYLHWYYKDRMVVSDGKRVRVTTELGPRSVSQLIVLGAVPDDQGIYTCSPENTLQYSVIVYVIEGPRALPKSSSSYYNGRSIADTLLPKMSPNV